MLPLEAKRHTLGLEFSLLQSQGADHISADLALLQESFPSEDVLHGLDALTRGSTYSISEDTGFKISLKYGALKLRPSGLSFLLPRQQPRTSLHLV